MNPRQRRGLLMIGLAVLGGLGIFAALARYVSDVEAQVGPLVDVVELRADLPPYEPVTAEMLAVVQVPRRWAPETAVQQPEAVLGAVTPTALAAGTRVQVGMFVPAPEIGPGQREIAILVDAETGVAGKVRPGSIVDVYATFPGTEGRPAQSALVVDRALVMDVGLETTVEDGDERGFTERNAVVPVTFAIDFADSLRVTYVESFAESVRLALRAPDDDEDVPADERRYQPLPDSPGA